VHAVAYGGSNKGDGGGGGRRSAILTESGFRIFCFVAKILAGRRGTTSQKRSPRGATGNDGISDDIRRGEK